MVVLIGGRCFIQSLTVKGPRIELYEGVKRESGGFFYLVHPINCRVKEFQNIERRNLSKHNPAGRIDSARSGNSPVSAAAAVHPVDMIPANIWLIIDKVTAVDTVPTDTMGTHWLHLAIRISAIERSVLPRCDVSVTVRQK